MKILDQQILSCMTVRLTERFPGLSPAFSLLSFQETVEKETGTDGSSFYYEKNLLRKAFLEDRLDFLFLHTLSHVLFLHFLPEASVEQEIWNLAADTAASYFVDTYLLPEESGESGTQKDLFRTAGRCQKCRKALFLPAEDTGGGTAALSLLSGR